MKLNRKIYDNNDHEVRSLIIAILKRRRGFRIQLEEGLSVGERGTSFSVIFQNEELLFSDAKKAVDFFFSLLNKGKNKEEAVEVEDVQLHIHFD